MLEKVTDLKRPPSPGRFYLVPCLPYRLPGSISEPGRMIDVPVFPYPHDDKELDPTNLPHCHHDYRFIDDELRDQINAGKTREVTVTIIGAHQYSWQRRKCVRYWNGADPFSKFKFVVGIKELCKNKKLKGKFCPHKGFDLSSVKRDDNGCLTCPLHGAKWDKNGNFVNPS